LLVGLGQALLERQTVGLLLEDHRRIGLGNLAQKGLVLGLRLRGVRLRR